MPEERLSKAIDDLRAEIRGVADLIRGERAERQAEARTDRRRIAAVIAAVVLVGAVVMLWNRADIRRNNQHFCGTTAIPLKLQPQPTAAIFREWVDESRKQFDSLGCDQTLLRK